MNNKNNQHFSEPEEQEIHLRDYLQVLRKRKGIILSVFGLVLLVTIIKTFTATPYYTASSQVLIERNRGMRSLDTQYYSYEPDFLETQSAIIRSAGVGKRVTDNLGLAIKYRHYFFRTEDNKKSFLSSIRGMVRGWIYGALSFFTSSDKTVGEAVSGDIVESRAEIKAEPMTEAEIIALMVSGGLRVTPMPNTKIVFISYRDRDPGMAKMVANGVVKAYMDEMLEIKLATSNYSLQWMTSKAEEERDNLERSERALQKYMRDNDLVTVENKLTIFPQKLSEFSSQLSRAEAERKELRSLLDQIKAVGNDFNVLENIPVFADNQVLKTVRGKIYKAKQNIKELSKKYGPKHPVMVKARDELEVLNNEKRFEVQRIVASTASAYEMAATREENLKELLAETKTEVLNLNEKYIQYSVLKRDVDSNKVLYNTLQATIKKEGITEQSQSVNIWVVSKAELPFAPSSPRKKRNIMLGIILGLFSGIGLAFLIEYLDNTAKSEVELERRYGITVLGTIAKLDGTEQKIESYIVRQPLSPLAESYRLIRSGLMLSSAERPPKSILVTSMGEGEGKTSTSVNLARVLAQGGKKVLVIDCDLRKPRVHSLFGVKNELGLSSYLTGNSDDGIVFSVPGEDLTMITSGPLPPNPAELLSSNRMEELLDMMKNRFDFVILDSSPIQSVTDGLALSRIAEGTIVVVRHGKTTYDALDAGMKKLRDVNAHILGFVLNGLKNGSSNYYGFSSDYAHDE